MAVPGPAWPRIVRVFHQIANIVFLLLNHFRGPKDLFRERRGIRVAIGHRNQDILDGIDEKDGRDDLDIEIAGKKGIGARIGKFRKAFPIEGYREDGEPVAAGEGF